MLKVNSINFKSQIRETRIKQKQNKNSAAIAGAIGVVTIGTTAIVAGKNKMAIKSYNDALKKCGVEIKDGFAILTKTGEKYTGSVKRNISINKKETTNFKDGVMSERIYYDILGRELEGEFYKDGNLSLKVGKHQGLIYKSFPYRQYKDGKIIRGDVFNQRIGSVFAWARNLLEKV